MPKSVYRQRNPQNSPYYQCVEDHFEIFEMIYEDRFERQYKHKKNGVQYLEIKVVK